MFSELGDTEDNLVHFVLIESIMLDYRQINDSRDNHLDGLSIIQVTLIVSINFPSSHNILLFKQE